MADDAQARPGTVHRQRARREHACVECPEPITAGQTYIYLNTFDRGKWSRYTLCLKCERIRLCHKIVEAALREEMPYAAGSMRDDVRAWHRSFRNYQHEFRLAWDASEPEEIEPPEEKQA